MTPEQRSVSEHLEPVACVNGCSKFFRHAPPQRKPLTDEQLIDLWPSLIMHQHTYAFARAIEAAHGIRDNP